MRTNVWLSDRVLQLQSRDLAVDFPIFRLRRPGTRLPWDRSQQIEGAVRQPEQWNNDMTNQQDGQIRRQIVGADVASATPQFVNLSTGPDTR